MVYPANDFENTEKLLRIIGSHWQNTYEGRALVEAFLKARGDLELQYQQDLVEAGDLLSRIDAPVYHTERWLECKLTESDRTARPIKYGDGTVYGPQPITGAVGVYGGSLTASEYVFPAPDGFVFSQLLQDKISEPSVSWMHGTDFVIDSNNSTVTFRTDPFADSNLIPTEVFEGDQVIDREITLWFKRASVDKRYIYGHFGYIAGVDGKSSEAYKQLLNAYFDSLVLGAAGNSVSLLLAAMLGVPTVKEEVEVVEAVYSTQEAFVVVTDLNAYRFHPNDTTSLVPGDSVYRGQLLTDAVQVSELSSGEVPAGLQALGLDSAFLTGYLNGVMFVNKTVDLVVEENVNGKTKVSFELNGHPADVEKFWDDVHAAGARTGVYLAEVLDTRGYPPPYEPNASTLPAQINPLEFLISNVLRFNAYIVKIYVNRSVQGAFGFSQLGLLRRIVPPWTTLILVTDSEVEEAPINLGSAGSTTAPGGSESLSTFTAATPIEESISGATRVHERVRVYAVEGFCR